MGTQTQTTEVKSCGIRVADEFAAEARELGLVVETKSTRSEAVYYHDGSVMLPARLSVTVTVTIPVPEKFATSALGMIERATRLDVCFSKSDAPRARGRWVLANYSTLGGHEDLHVKHKAHSRLQHMASDLKSLQKLAED